MSSIVFPQYSSHVCKSIFSSIVRLQPKPDYYYMFFGKLSEWENDESPPTPNLTYNNTARQNIMALKRINSSNIAILTSRNDWTSGTTYDKFDETDSNLNSKAFYVITDEFNVYKCLDNNNRGESTIKPSGTNINSFTAGDGYIWKFMYNLSSSLQEFLDDDYMPVPYSNQKTNEHLAVENNSEFDHGYDAVTELFADSIKLTQSFESIEGGILPVDISYRQVGIIINPTDSNKNLLTNTLYYIDSNTDVNTDSGNLIFLENRLPVVRDLTQDESFDVTLTF